MVNASFTHEIHSTRFRSGMTVLISFAFHASLLSIIALSSSLTHVIHGPLGNSQLEATTITFVPLPSSTDSHSKTESSPSLPTKMPLVKIKTVLQPIAAPLAVAVTKSQTPTLIEPTQSQLMTAAADPSNSASSAHSASESAATHSTRLGSLNGTREANALGEYLFELRRQIDLKKVYPSLSRRMGEIGKVLVSLEILRDGSIQDIKIKTSSKYSRLDQAALDTLKSLETHSPLPSTVAGDRITVEVPIDFTL